MYSETRVSTPIDPSTKDINTPAEEDSSVAETLRREWHEYITNPWMLVVVLLILFGLLSQLKSRHVVTESNAVGQEFPQLYMTDVNVREFNDLGELAYQIRTEQITQYQIDLNAPSPEDYYLLRQPVFTFYEKHPTPWQISSINARGLADGKVMDLQGDVVIQQDSNEFGLLTANTETLTIHTDTQFAQTDKAVTMRSPKSQMDAIGMKANLQENHIEMLSNVKVVYEPQ